MFTGIVEELGAVAAIEDQGDAVRLTVRGPLVVGDAALGDSIAVNGCCLTVAGREGETFTADVMRETLLRTSLGALAPGSRVNLERAVTAGTRLGGHLVQGHVDATGTVVERTPSEHWELVRVSLPAALKPYLVVKGSITVDGVSLTVVEVVDGAADGAADRAADRAADGAADGAADRAPDRAEGTFTVSLIPETLARTTLGLKQPGDPVNLEVDVIAKYVERMLMTRRAGTGAPEEDT